MLNKYMRKYIDVSRNVLKSMFSLDISLIDTDITLTNKYSPSKNITVHIPFFGNIAGDFFFSVDEKEWKHIVRNTIGSDDEEIAISGLKELLNIVVGETITVLKEEFSNLTYLSPRVIKGEIYYPAVKTISTEIAISPMVSFELGISLDMMKIDINEELLKSKSEISSKTKLLARSERMDVLGKLVESILLDLQDPVEHLESSFKQLNEAYNISDEDKFTEFVADMNQSLARVKNIAGSLVNFSKSNKKGITELDLEKCVHDAIIFSKVTYPNNINIKVAVSSLPLTNSNPEKIKQVIINLLINAYEELEDINNPEIMIDSFSEKSYCGLKITYNNPVLSVHEENWKPLFSKKSDNLTCLGLSVCREILQIFGGDLFSTKEELYSTLTLILPVNQK